MRFAHISDLHIGKRVNDFSMLEDQRYILDEIIKIITQQKADAVLVAGDIYDKTQPSAEAVALCDDFFYALAELDKHIFIISGNHDCPERIAYGARIMENCKFHIASVYNGNIKKVSLSDEEGQVNVYLLPFIKPAVIRPYFENERIESYNDALRAVIEKAGLCRDERNVLVAHQFVTGASRCDSEDITVGTLDNVDVNIFDGFDYVALGHIHGPQQAGRPEVRYCGSPLKYSFSEIKQQKSVTIADVKKSGVEIKTIPLEPKRQMRRLKGAFDELAQVQQHLFNNDDYMYITLTDEQDIPDAIGRLRTFYPNIMKLDYDNVRTRGERAEFDRQASQSRERQPLEMFEELYELQNNQPMDEQQRAYIKKIIEEIWT